MKNKSKKKVLDEDTYHALLAEFQLTGATSEKSKLYVRVQKKYQPSAWRAQFLQEHGTFMRAFWDVRPVTREDFQAVRNSVVTYTEGTMLVDLGFY